MGLPIITVSRQYGSAGRDVARQVAETLQIPYYDKEVISMTAEKTGFSEEVVKNEEMKRSVLSNPLFSLTQMIDVQVFMTQSEIIQQLAVQPCVIVGRCADYVLRDMPNVVNFFLYGELGVRTAFAVKERDLPSAKATEAVTKFDKRRASYYHYYTGKKWGEAKNYHLCMDTTHLTPEKTAEIILQYVSLL